MTDETRQRGKPMTIPFPTQGDGIGLTKPCPVTEELVERFSAALLAKLRAAEIKYNRKDDWARDDWKADCQRKLLEHVAKGDPLDVAAYAAFCWFHGWRTAE